MSEFCHEDETEEDLQRNGYRILQKKEGFRFGLDAVLLSSFVRAGQNDRLLDMGTGCGVIPILLEAKTGCSDITGLEIVPGIADMAARSVKMNGLEDRIQIINGDCREAGHLFGEASFDIVTCNPPYLKSGGPVSNDPVKAVARHEICLSLDEMAREMYLVLKPHGRAYIVHRPERLAGILGTFMKNRLAPKRIRFVHPRIDSPASLVLIEARRDAREGLKTEPPLIVYSASGGYSDEAALDYGLAQAGSEINDTQKLSGRNDERERKRE